MATARRARTIPFGNLSNEGTARGAEPAVHTTLLELVRTLGEITDDEREIVATVIHMLRSGSVVLTGTFRGTSPDRLLD